MKAQAISQSNRHSSRSTKGSKPKVRVPRGLGGRKRIGKYRIGGKIGEGNFASVYKAMDTIEGTLVALKVPHDEYVTPESLESFRREARMVSQLDHPNILPVKDADIIEQRFVIAFRLGEKSLDDRLRNRLSVAKAIEYSDQILAAVEHAHQKKVVHCDIKPENFILFSGDLLRLTDFGVAKVAQRTLRGSGTGTVGYMAPEQAMGRPSPRSDVFSIGLIMYRMFSGQWPEWPFEWPPAGYDRVRRRIHPDLIRLVKRAMDVHPRNRFRDAIHMRKEFLKLKRKSLRFAEQRKSR